ncbi:MAG TPA: serine/threonine-protein kinase [Polyangia bacterium]|jgi:serine/threonine protein kinase|nr:serine/threonine-protein kinase [Polyangia bacterium]
MRYGKYQLIQQLGKGGMAEVWLAQLSGPAGFSRSLVIKRILPDLAQDPHFLALFLAEARLSARLHHPNIVQVSELGEHEGEFFLAMEYIHGRDLVSVVRAALNEGLATPELGTYVIREVARALAYAHALTDDQGRPLNIIHRDVSPSNIMVSFDGAVKLLDFGVAKARDQSSAGAEALGRARSLKGKFAYMAPEQITGEAIDHRVDIFAAGVVLWEMVTGKRLFKGATELLTLELVRDAKVPPPSSFNSAVPAQLDAIVLHATARDPAARYATADQFAKDLDELVHEHRWGPARMAELMRNLFPGRYVSRPRVTGSNSRSLSSVLLGAYANTPLPVFQEVPAQPPVESPPELKESDALAALRPTQPAVPVLEEPPRTSLVTDSLSDAETPVFRTEAPSDQARRQILDTQRRPRSKRRSFNTHLWLGIGLGTLVGLIGVAILIALLRHTHLQPAPPPAPLQAPAQ